MTYAISPLRAALQRPLDTRPDLALGLDLDIAYERRQRFLTIAARKVAEAEGEVAMGAHLAIQPDSDDRPERSLGQPVNDAANDFILAELRHAPKLQRSLITFEPAAITSGTEEGLNAPENGELRADRPRVARYKGQGTLGSFARFGRGWRGNPTIHSKASTCSQTRSG